jgi:hypothetical protein
MERAFPERLSHQPKGLNPQPVDYPKAGASASRRLPNQLLLRRTRCSCGLRF